jgi:hypothetical protein
MVSKRHLVIISYEITVAIHEVSRHLLGVNEEKHESQDNQCAGRHSNRTQFTALLPSLFFRGWTPAYENVYRPQNVDTEEGSSITAKLLSGKSICKELLCRSQQPHGLRRESAAARLLRCGRMDVYLLWMLCCPVEVSTTGRSLVQRSPTECGVSVCDIITSTMRRPRPD